MDRFSDVPFKTEMFMDFQFNCMEAGKCQVYWEWKGEHE